MKKITLVIVCIAVVITAAVIGCNSATKPSTKNEGISEVQGISTPTTEEQIERGRYLVTTMLCHDCHSPKIMTPAGPEIDSSRMLSGHPADMPVPKYNATDAQSWILFNH
ncbi:MAG: diheme cytochrome c-553, partial [Bacteroidota bacterium]